MITLVYLIKPEDSTIEKQWLNGMQIYPSMRPYIDWIENKMYTQVGVIVSADCALAIKLRHPLQLQADYLQR